MFQVLSTCHKPALHSFRGVPEDRRAVVEVVLRGGEPFLRAAAGRSVEVDTRDASSPHTAVLLVPLADLSNGPPGTAYPERAVRAPGHRRVTDVDVALSKSSERQNEFLLV